MIGIKNSRTMAVKMIPVMVTLVFYVYAGAQSQLHTNISSSHSSADVINTSNSTDIPNVELDISVDSNKEKNVEEPTMTVNRRKFDDHSLYMLQRISDRLTALLALDEQQLRRLETLEYRMTRLESQNLDRVEGIRSTVADMNRRIQDMEREFETTKTALDLLHQDAVGLRRGQVQLRREIVKVGMKTKGEVPDNDKDGGSLPSESINADTLNKLQLLTPTIYSILGSIGSLQHEISSLRLNLTNISNMTSYMNNIASSLITKDYLSILLADARQESASPAKSLFFPQHQYLMMATDVKKERIAGEEIFAEDCMEILQNSPQNKTNSSKEKKTFDGKKSGVYLIQPKWSSRPFFVYCDMVTRGGGWTVFQNRYEGTVDFFRDWQGYKNGFGNLAGEFWLGLEKLHLLTNNKVNELLVQLEDFEHEKATAKFNSFAIGSEAEGYQITLLGDYQGEAGDSLSYHVGMKFSTHDSDQDEWLDGNCAQTRSGAWWYKGCEASNLNGRYLNGHLPPEYENQGIYWQDWHGPQYSLMKSRMAIRTRDVVLPKSKEEDKVKEDSSELDY